MFESFDIMSEPILYDIFNANCTEDIDMYKSMCANKKIVLELGIGTGRLAIPLAQNGIHVVGIDNCPKMLAALQNKLNMENIKHISYYQQDMRFLSLNSQFDIILCPFCTFNFLLTIEDQEKALISIKKLMKHNSNIVFDLLTLNTFPDSFQDSTIKHFDTYTELDDESTIEIYTSSKFNQCNQIFLQKRIFRRYVQGLLTAEFYTTMKNRFFYLGEFQLLLDKCGYKILNTYGDYNFSPFSKQSQNLIVVATLK